MRNGIFKIGLLCLFLATVNYAGAQKVLVPFDLVSDQDMGRQLFEMDTIIHLSYKPLLMDRSLYDTLIANTHNRFSGKTYKKWVGRKLFRENLVVIDKKDFFLTIDFLMNFQGGQDLNDTSNNFLTTNTRALSVQGNITDKIYFRTDFYETQSYFPAYIDSFINANSVVPGQGRAKIFKETGWDYPVASGIVNYQATKNLNFQIGHDKLFIGNGYRSLLLSDNASNYPFLQIGLNFLKNKLNYHATYASLQVLQKINDSEGTHNLFIKKVANFNYLSFKPSPLIEIGLFEGVVWERWNEENGQLPFDYWFVNPVIFVNSIVKAKDTLVSSNLGLNLLVKPFKKTGFYGQFAWNGKSGTGFQLGVRGYDLFTIKGLSYFAEYNQVSKNMYGFNAKGKDYYHYNQPLAHQQVEQFDEIVVYAAYRVKRFLLRAKYNYIANSNVQNSPRFLNVYDFNLGYVFNPMTNLMFNAGFMMRDEVGGYQTQFIYVGLRTSLRNIYYDF